MRPCSSEWTKSTSPAFRCRRRLPAGREVRRVARGRRVGLVVGSCGGWRDVSVPLVLEVQPQRRSRPASPLASGRPLPARGLVPVRSSGWIPLVEPLCGVDVGAPPAVRRRRRRRCDDDAGDHEKADHRRRRRSRASARLPLEPGCASFLFFAGFAEPLALFFPAVRHSREQSSRPPPRRPSSPRPRSHGRAACSDAEHGAGGRRAVERVEVDARHAGEQQLSALLGGVGDAELELGPLVSARGAEGGFQPARDRGVAEARRSALVWAKLATGITPARIGTSIPRARAAATKSK